MDEYIRSAKAISDATRARILKLLEHGELCVCEIMEVLGLRQSTASKHLGILKAAGLVQSRKDGAWSHYRLPQKPGDSHKAFLAFIKTQLNNDTDVINDRKRLTGRGKNSCRT